MASKHLIAWILLWPIVLASGCSSNEELQTNNEVNALVQLVVPPETTLAGVFYVESGEVRSELGAVLEYAQPSTDIALGDLEQGIKLTGLRYEHGYGCRVSAIAYEPLGMGVGLSAECKCFLVTQGDLSEKDSLMIMDVIGNSLKLPQFACSAITSDICFDTSDYSGYVAIYFYPKYTVISGQMEVHGVPTSFEAWYPCLNDIGCLDGMYKVNSAATPEHYYSSK